jgi:enoyl-CoA hydratase/carnithine racemase
MRHDLVHEQTLAPGLLRWTLSHPAKRNALSPDMLAWLQRRAAALAGEVVLLSGEGPSFCAGFDLDALPEDPVAKDMSEAPDAALVAATAALRRADATFVAVLHGPIFGAGVELACCCDLRLARDDTRFTVPAARLGVVYHPAGVDLLQRCLGLALTQRLLLLGDTLDAADLLRTGGVHGVYPAAELAGAADRAIERLMAGAPASLRAHRDRLRGQDPGADPGSYEAARRAAYHSEDYREGRAAARERRPARFTGR